MGTFKTVGDWVRFMEGRKVIVTGDHEWAGEKTDFVEVAYADGTRAHDDDKVGAHLRMKVSTRFRTELLLEPKNFFIVEKEMVQRPAQN